MGRSEFGWKCNPRCDHNQPPPSLWDTILLTSGHFPLNIVSSVFDNFFEASEYTPLLVFQKGRNVFHSHKIWLNSHSKLGEAFNQIPPWIFVITLFVC
ncbi:hypothetical protein AN189_11435 [Loktanella sp. 3ANDIMAR09]|nr:hypothetical protein AN189_11435 [Loktanella sp. 3ANDIMAR09]